MFFSFSLHYFQFPGHTPGPTVCISHFPPFSVFRAIFHYLQCVFLIFYDFQFSHHIPDSIVYIYHFPIFFSVSCLIPGPTVCVLYFPWISVYLPYSRSNCVHLFFTFFSFSRRYSFTIVCVSHFPWFSVFSPYSMSYSMSVSFSRILSVSCHIPGSTMCMSYFSGFSLFLAIFHVLQCTFPICHVFWVLLAIIEVKKCLWLLFRVFFFSFLTIFQVIQCFYPYFMSYSVHFTFSTFFNVSHHILGHTVSMSHFPRFSVILP